MVERKMPAEVCERLLLGWMPSPAYPGRLGVAGSMLIPHYQYTTDPLFNSLTGEDQYWP